MKGHTRRKPTPKQKKKKVIVPMLQSRELERSIAEREAVIAEHMVHYPALGTYSDIDEQTESLLAYHEALQHIEQAVSESIGFFEDLRNLEDESDQGQVQAWRTYLGSVRESCSQLVKSIEASTRPISDENR